MKKKVMAGIMAVMLTFSTMGVSVSANRWYGSDAKGWKYQYDSGDFATKGWLESGGHKYYITSDGTRKTGWMETTSGNTYYFTTKGIMATGWYTINKEKYYFGDDGVMVTGVLKKGKHTYYFYEDGRLYKTETQKVRKKVTTETYTSTIVEIRNPDGTVYTEESEPKVKTEVKYID